MRRMSGRNRARYKDACTGLVGSSWMCWVVLVLLDVELGSRTLPSRSGLGSRLTDLCSVYLVYETYRTVQSCSEKLATDGRRALKRKLAPYLGVTHM